jgi:hypothetical protein
MSAYICNPEHFGILAAYAVLNRCDIYEWEVRVPSGAQVKTAQRIAEGLAQENIRSVAYRYPNDADGDRPGPCLLDAQIIEAAQIYAAHFVKHPQSLTPIQAIKLVEALDYQSCETPDWPETLAKRQLEWIRSCAIRQLPGYEDAEWKLRRKVPAVEALFERRAA